MSITEKPKCVALPWDTKLIRIQMDLRYFSHRTLACLISTRAGKHFSRSYVTKVLGLIRRPSVPFVRAMSHELGLPLPPEGELMGLDEYMIYRLNVAVGYIEDIRNEIGKGEYICGHSKGK